MTVVEVLFLVFASVAIFSALLTVTSDQLVHAALWFVITLGALAACYLVLAAEFVAWVQVLIYIGSVVVLLLFALMLTRAPTGPGSATFTPNKLAAGTVAVLTSLSLAVVMYAGFAGQRIETERISVGSAAALGDAIFSSWVLPFEILSLVLLAALVGAIVLSRAHSHLGAGGED